MYKLYKKYKNPNYKPTLVEKMIAFIIVFWIISIIFYKK